MNKLKQILCAMLSVCVIGSTAAVLPFAAGAKTTAVICSADDETLFEGKCGENLTYKFDPSTATMTISGTGEMYNTDYLWESYKYRILSLTVEDGVTRIGDGAFSYCDSLKELNIADSVTSIGSGAFFGTEWIENQSEGIVYAGKVAYLYNGNIPNTISIAEGTKGIADFAFAEASNLRSAVIPGSVENIGEWAFGNCNNLNSVTMYVGVSTIGNRAFFGCENLTSVTIPEGVTKVGVQAFQRCKNLNTIVIPASVQTVGIHAFADTAWYENQPDGIIYAGNVAYSFKGEVPESVTVAQNTKSISEAVFENSDNLKELTIPETVEKIDEFALTNCVNLEKITVDENNKVFDSRDNCNAIIETETNTLVVGCQSTVIPVSVTEIADNAFYKCINLQNIVIPNNVKTIGNYAFYGCDKLTAIIIPDSVISIGDYEFYNCTNLSSVAVSKNIVNIGKCAFVNCDQLKSLSVPASATKLGKYAFGFYNNAGEDYSFVKYDDFVVYGKKGSAAESYAAENGIAFTEEIPVKTSIAKAKVTLAKTSYKYTGKNIKPKVTVVLDKVTLGKTAYKVTYKNNKKVGKATVTVTGIGDYTGAVSKTFTIKKADNTLKISNKSKKVKYSAVRKKAVTALKLKADKAVGKVSFKITKKHKYITVKSSGQVILKKKTKKGNYSVKVKVTAKGNTNYKSASKTIKVKITVK